MKYILGVFLLLAAPAAMACEQIGSRFEYCFEGTSWATADIESFGDGATFLLNDLTLDQNEPYPGRSDGPVADDMAAVNDFFEVDRSSIIDTLPINAKGKTGLIQLRSDFDLASLVAEAIVVMGDARVLIWMTAPQDADRQATLAYLNEAISALNLM